MTLQDESDPAAAKDRAVRNAVEMVKHIPPALVNAEGNIAQQLKMHRGNAFTKLSVLHRMLDEFAAVMKPYVACKSGCAACCHYNVSLFPVEAEYIERETGHKRLLKLLDAQDFHGQACPFLTNGKCGIYKARPISCRIHVAFTATAYWCAPERSASEKFQLVDLTGVREALIDIAKANGGLGHIDVRQVFAAKPTRP